MWVNHHALFTRIDTVDAGLLWRNLALLLPLSVLPFPTAVLADTLQTGTPGDQLAASTLYALVGAVMAGTWLLVFAHLARRPGLLHEHAAPAFFRAEYVRAVLGNRRLRRRRARRADRPDAGPGRVRGAARVLRRHQPRPPPRPDAAHVTGGHDPRVLIGR